MAELVRSSGGSLGVQGRVNDTWDENYGAGAAADGPNIALSPGADSSVKFYYSHGSHWITDNLNSRIVTARFLPGGAGLRGDWILRVCAPGCRIPTATARYLQHDSAARGPYEARRPSMSRGRDYGAGGVAGGGQRPQRGPADGDAVTFTFVADQTLTIARVGWIRRRASRRNCRAGADDVTYFVFARPLRQRRPSNDEGGDFSGTARQRLPARRQGLLRRRRPPASWAEPTTSTVSVSPQSG